MSSGFNATANVLLGLQLGGPEQVVKLQRLGRLLEEPRRKHPTGGEHVSRHRGGSPPPTRARGLTTPFSHPPGVPILPSVATSVKSLSGL